MSDLSGYIELEIAKKNGETDYLTVDGEEFELAEGGDPYIDPDDGKIACSFLYRGACDGFVVYINAHTHNATVRQSATVGDIEYESHGIVSVTVIANEIEDGSFLHHLNNDNDY